MSEAKKSRESKAKSVPAPEGKSESVGTETKATAAATAEATAEAKDGGGSTPAASTDAKTSDGTKDSGKEGAKEGGKSARESTGGKADAHYGYFSSVRTPAYRSGWDAIWGSQNGESDESGENGENGEEAPRRRSAARAGRPAKAGKRRDPITVTLDLDALPPQLREGLVEIARAELKKSRVSYARREKAGAVDWRITCRVD